MRAQPCTAILCGQLLTQTHGARSPLFPRASTHRYGPKQQPPIYTYYDGDANLFGARKPHLPQEFTLEDGELITRVELQWDPISMRCVCVIVCGVFVTMQQLLKALLRDSVAVAVGSGVVFRARLQGV